MIKQIIVNEYYCDKCGTKIDGTPEFAGFNDEIHLCYQCFCDYYGTCSVCNTTLPDDDIYYDIGGETYCERCVPDLQKLYEDQLDCIKNFRERHKS